MLPSDGILCRPDHPLLAHQRQRRTSVQTTQDTQFEHGQFLKGRQTLAHIPVVRRGTGGARPLSQPGHRPHLDLHRYVEAALPARQDLPSRRVLHL